MPFLMEVVGNVCVHAACILDSKFACIKVEGEVYLCLYGLFCYCNGSSKSHISESKYPVLNSINPGNLKK